MSESTASVRPFDDRPYLAKIQAFKDCLLAIRQQHEASMQRYGQKSVTAEKPKRKPTQMTFVYLLEAGSERQPVTGSSSRHFVAPLWASISERAA